MFARKNLILPDKDQSSKVVSSIHSFIVEGIAGQEIRFADFSGKKILVVNVASACGYTPQYAQLQELYTHYQDQLVVVGFPSNDFGGQEPGSNADVAAFCTARYGVTFPLTAKVHIKSDPVHPVYQWLTQQASNGKMDAPVKWNFQKFLLDEAGQLIATFPSSTDPLDSAILQHLSN